MQGIGALHNWKTCSTMASIFCFISMSSRERTDKNALVPHTTSRNLSVTWQGICGTQGYENTHGNSSKGKRNPPNYRYKWH